MVAPVVGSEVLQLFVHLVEIDDTIEPCVCRGPRVIGGEFRTSPFFLSAVMLREEEDLGIRSGGRRLSCCDVRRNHQSRARLAPT